MGPHDSKAMWDFAKICLESGSGLGFRLELRGWGMRVLGIGRGWRGLAVQSTPCSKKESTDPL